MAYGLGDFSEIVDAVVAELKHDANDTNEIIRIKRDINVTYRDEVVPAGKWRWLLGHTQVRFSPYLANGTVAVTPDSATITFSVAPSTSKTGYYFAIDNFNEIYTIASHTAGETTATLSTVFTGSLDTAATYKVWTDKVVLPTDCRETIEVWNDFFARTMEARGLQDFRRVVNESPRASGYPYYYTTYDYVDPTPLTDETESDRYRVLLVYPSVNEFSTTLKVDYIKEVELLDADGDEPLMPVEDRVVLVYGALAKAWRRARNPEEAMAAEARFQNKLALMKGRTEDSQDKPQLTPDSRYLSKKRSKGLMGTQRSNAFAGGGSYTAPTYLPSNVTIAGGTLTGNLTVNSGVTIDGVDISALSTSISDHVADTSDAHDASAISNTASGNLTSTDVQSSLVELQTDVDTRATSASLTAHIDDTADAHAASAITNTPSGNLAATTVQAALDELQGDIDAHLADTTDAHDASAVSVVATGNLASTTVQAALEELQGDINTINTLADGKIYLGNGSNVATEVTPTGDVTISNAGVTAIASGVIVDADISASAAITRSKLATGTASHVVIHDGSGNLSSEAQLAVSRGGTNSGAALNNNRVMQSSGSAIVEAAAITASRALVSDANGIPTHATTTATEIGYVNGVTSAIQTQINTKAPTASPTFSGTITTPLTASRALTTGASSELAVSAVTATELGYVSGVTSAIQTQLNALGSPRMKNYLINPEFRYWQHQAAPGTLANYQDDTYAADGWILLNGGGAVNMQARRVSSEVTGDGNTYAGQFRNADASARQFGVLQIIEGQRCKDLRGQTVTFQIKASTDGTEITTIRIGIVEWTGTEDSVTSDIVSSWSNTPTLIANAAFVNTPADITISSSWTTCSVTATLGSTFNNLMVFVWVPSTEATSDDLYLANAQLVKGSTAGSWQNVALLPDDDLRYCQRYYEVRDTVTFRAYNPNVAASASIGGHVSFHVQKRTTPTITLSNTSGTKADTIVGVNETAAGFQLSGNLISGSTGNAGISASFAADARL